MKFDSEPYKVQFVQKSSPTRSDDFLFAEIYKFFTDKKLKYIVRAELYENNTFTVKYYAAIHKYLDDKYSVLTHQQDAHRIFITCFAIFNILIEKYPDASFAVNGSCSVDAQHNKIEGENRNQRYRIYSYVIDRLIGRETFAHYILPELSSYVLVNRVNKVNKDTEAQRDAIKEMFLNLFDFDTDL